MDDILNTPDPLETMTKDECIKMYDLLRELSPRQWRFLRDYPRDCAWDGPAAARDARGAFTQIFLDAGMLSNAHPPPQLTPLGHGAGNPSGLLYSSSIPFAFGSPPLVLVTGAGGTSRP